MKKLNVEESLMRRRVLKILLIARLFISSKVTKADRDKLREKRNELKIIIKRSRAICFEYIVNREAQRKVCFGSTLKRDVLPTKSKTMNSFMRRLQDKPKAYPGPGDYTVETSLIKKYATKHGYSSLAYKSPRVPPVYKSTKVPPVGTYDCDIKKPIKISRAPFGVNAKLEKPVKFVTPGPGSYNFPKKKFFTAEAFGTKRQIIPAVKVICSPVNIAICKICEEVPLGDYFYSFQTKEDICRPCMQSEYDELKKCHSKILQKAKKLAELKSFARVRYCDFYHNHNGTTAAVAILDKNILRKKLRKENYLSMYDM